MLLRALKNRPLVLEMIGGILVAALILTATAATIYWAFDLMVASSESIKHTNSVLALANRTRNSSQEAYAAGNGFAVTGAANQLLEHTRAVQEVLRQLRELQALINDPVQLDRLQAIELRFNTWRKQIATPVLGPRVDAFRTAGADMAETFIKGMIRRSDNEALRAEIRAIWESFMTTEQVLLVTSSAERDRAIRWAKVAILSGPLLALLVSLAAGLRQALRLRRNLQIVTDAARDVAAGDGSRRAGVPDIQEVRALATAFNHMAAALEAREHEASLLHQLVDLLAACRNLAEAGEAAAAIGKQLFPGGGGLFLANNSHSLVEPLVSWGGMPSEDCTAFHPDECWALRRGQSFGPSKGRTTSTLRCRHITTRPDIVTLCVPLLAQGDALSLLHLCWAADSPGDSPRPDLVHAFSEQLALALANVRLRERLVEQSLRDPLTGLFNRRYLEETLERELARARRNKVPIGFLMLDVDHFKLFNDSHGHGGGDVLLQAMATALRGQLRREDIACRYGGEEFLLILPGASLADTHRRAEDVRLTVSQLAVTDHGRALGAVTTSVGVAAYPEHGADAALLIRIADAALYEAKHRGRNQVVVAEVPEDGNGRFVANDNFADTVGSRRNVS